MIKIIGICGFKGAGKDTIADYLVNNKNFIKISFASVIKDIISILFVWDRNMLEGITQEDRLIREQEDIWWSNKLGVKCTPRWAMQNIGTDIFRKYFNDNIWIYSLQKRLESNKNVNYVISDVRFPNEIEFLKSINATLIYVERNDPEEWFYNLEKVPEDLHVSEWAWIKYLPEICIKNKGTKEDLHREIENKLNF
jgi:hypothetical protein